ncbi:unnamed protein product, partial [Adineta steineri]
PLIIREVRPPQAAPPPTLVINECPPLPEKQPPLILREEPPIPPPIIPSETITKYLPAISAPARSVLIKRYPALPTRPRDILIERWLPYGPRPQRETITYPAPPAISYPEPFFRIIQYEAGHASIHHRFETLFARENPEYYRTRYGSSLLDTTTLLRLAREAGVSEDLTLPPAPPLLQGYGGFGGTHDYHMYGGAKVSSSAPKLAWDDFLQVLQVFMLGNHQEQELDIKRAFDILDQCSRGLYGRTVSLADGLISPDELRAFLSILTDEYRVDLCVFLADTDGSGQISLSEFTRMVKSGLARDIICECI